MISERTLTISKDHPALPGHFPGHPVVPGVLVLDEVIASLKKQYEQRVIITGLPSVKLSSSLFPEEELTIRVEPESPETAAFTCRVGNRLVASGLIQFRLLDSSRAGRP